MTLEAGPKVQEGDCTGVMIPASPDDFTGTPVHTQLAYLIASSRVTVSTAPPSGTDPPP